MLIHEDENGNHTGVSCGFLGRKMAINMGQYRWYFHFVVSTHDPQYNEWEYIGGINMGCFCGS